VSCSLKIIIIVPLVTSVRLIAIDKSVVMWQSSESSGSPSTLREAWMSSSGPFTRLPAPPHVSGDVSVRVCNITSVSGHSAVYIVRILHCTVTVSFRVQSSISQILIRHD